MPNSLIKFLIDDRVAFKSSDVSLLFEFAGNLLLAESQMNIQVKKGIIHAVGPDCTQATVDEYAVFLSSKGIEVMFKDEKYLIMREMDIEFVANKEEIEALPKIEV